MCMLPDNCLLEVQLAQRLIELKEKYGKSAVITDLSWKSRLKQVFNMSKVHPETPDIDNKQVAETKSKEAGDMRIEAAKEAKLKFGDLEMVLPLFLGRQDDHGNLGNFFAPNCYRLFGQFPAGVSRATSSRCQDHLRELISQQSERNDHQEETALDIHDQRSGDDVESQKLSKPIVVALTVDEKIKSRAKDMVNFKEDVIEKVLNILKDQVPRTKARDIIKILYVKRGENSTTATVVLLADANDPGLNPVRLAQSLCDPESNSSCFSKTETLGSIDNAVATMMQEDNSGRILSGV